MNILVIAALIPALVLMWYIWKKDKVEKEPTKVIAGIAGAGGISVISAIILELLGDAILLKVLEIDETSMTYGFLNFFLVVAFSEELGKLVALRLKTWKSRDFNYTYDAVVYAVASSLGFAAIENIMYVLIGGLGTAFMRAFTAVPGHAIFGVFMGYYYGMARQAWGRGKKGSEIKNMLLAFVVPVILHGIYDFCLFEYAPEGMIFVFLVFLVIIFILALIKINKLAEMDTPILGTGLDFPEDRAPNSIASVVSPVTEPIKAAIPSPYQQPVMAQPAPQYGQPMNAPQYGQPSNAPQYAQTAYGQPAPYGQSVNAPQYNQPAAAPQPSAPPRTNYGFERPEYVQAPSYGQPANPPQYGQPVNAPASAPEPPPEPVRPRRVYHPEGEAPDDLSGMLSAIDEEPTVRYDPFGIAPAQTVKKPDAADNDPYGTLAAAREKDPYGTAGSDKDPYGTLSSLNDL